MDTAKATQLKRKPMAQLPTINVRVVDGELLEMLATLLDDISKLDLDALNDGMDCYEVNEVADQEVFKIKNIYLYAQAASERLAEILAEIEARVDDLEIHLTSGKQ